MSKHTAENIKTTGIGTFGGEEGKASTPPLFRVEPGHSADYALMQASQMMACVTWLTLHAGMESDGTMAWAAHFISGMAKGLMEDVAHSMFVGDSEAP